MSGIDRAMGNFGPGLRPVEWVLCVYLVVTAILVLLGARTLPHPFLLLSLHLVGVGLIVLMARTSSRAPVAIAFVRRIFPLVLGPLFYLEIGVLNDVIWGERYFDPYLVSLERTLFGVDTSQVFARAWSWTWVSELLHLGYGSYYALPALLFVVLVLRREWAGLEWYLTVLALTFGSCQIWFVLVPVTGPYHYFGPLDPPAPGSLFPPLVNAVVSGGSSIGTAFPSSHVAVACCVLACAWRTARITRWILAVLVTLLTVGTVYGGFHYLVDSLAGILWCGVTFVLGSWLHRRLQVRRLTPRRAGRLRSRPVVH
ncbi:MAG TPA: phosphatase PAP2 family protein [Candidatus Krumholzibacteria bacterium]|nr:phosphatase PAP2 family protein [Candidatus Krumholzibacteria bacterium]